MDAFSDGWRTRAGQEFLYGAATSLANLWKI